MFGAIKHGLFNVANFNGRDARQTFWFYVLFVAILRFCVGLLASIPMTARMVSVGMEAAQNPGDTAAMQAKTFAVLADMLPMMAWMGVAVGAVTMALLLASAVRRAHDSGLSGWLMLAPGLLYAAALARQPIEAERAMKVLQTTDGKALVDPAALMQGGGGLQILLAWVPVLIIIFIGLRKSSEGPNRFGDGSARF